MSLKINKNENIKRVYVIVISLLLLFISSNIVFANERNFVWIKTFKAGSADLNDATIDKKVLTFVDSLMKRDDIGVTFLGGADNLMWRQTNKVEKVSNAWDQAKKLERASALRARYGKGEIGTTDESIRGVKVVWGPKKPDPFEMKQRVQMLENTTDSLTLALLALHSKQNNAFAALEDSLKNGTMLSYTEISHKYFSWEVTSGIFLWSQGAPYDLAVPYLGLALKRQNWELEFQGGFTPWSRKYSDGNRSDAFLMSTFNIFPDTWYELKIGGFTGWEFFTNSDEWTMKVMGLTAGPNFKWKYINLFIGSNLSNLHTLAKSSEWGQSIILTTSFNIEL